MNRVKYLFNNCNTSCISFSFLEYHYNIMKKYFTKIASLSHITEESKNDQKPILLSARPPPKTR